MAESILGNISQEQTLSELLGNFTLVMAAMLEKMPRIDANDRLIINAAEITAPVTVSSGTVTSVTSVSTLLAAGFASRPLDGLPVQMSNAGAMHIYDNIRFS
jgi:hypothetical protein